MKTKSYKIKVTFSDGSYKYIFANRQKLISSKNVIKYCMKKYPNLNIKEIKTRCYNNNAKKYYWELNYNLFFERARINRHRVQAENKPGYEDYSGYGARTEGKFNRFYIGRSTGFIPIYLEILKSNSYGGGGLISQGRKFTVVY